MPFYNPRELFREEGGELVVVDDGGGCSQSIYFKSGRNIIFWK